MKKILICIDQTLRSEKVASEGILMAKSMNAEVSLIHVVNSNAGLKPGKEREHEKFLERKKVKARKFLENIININSCAALIYIDEGDPGERIVAKAEMLKPDLIVLGNNKRKGHPPGHTVKNITKGIRTPVIIV